MLISNTTLMFGYGSSLHPALGSLGLGMEASLKVALSMMFIVALYLPWCRYLSAQELYADHLKCVSGDSDLLLRAARFTTGYVRLVGQEPAPIVPRGRSCLLIDALIRSLCMLHGVLGRFGACSIGANHCRLRHVGWERCSHGLSSRLRESASGAFLDQLLLLFQ